MSFSKPLSAAEAAAIDEMIAEGRYGLNEIAKIAGRGYELVRKRARAIEEKQYEQRQAAPEKQQHRAVRESTIRRPTMAELMAGRSSYGNPRL